MSEMSYLDQLLATVASETSYALHQLDGGPEGGYGPRLLLPYWRKKAIGASLRKIASEVQMFRSTAMEHDLVLRR